ncbi:DNA polymerase III, subunit gamma and tau [Carboxydothermus islandicus]|uniref:DNA-directed DNA polymerase n=1 Tax=Carboxydothermus islandicus TaxID=661089 RepID=A0A1L8CYZ1_9THEO|nr:DNA polymerase III subunit gamma/tau [Carboxydothermus islandicus]GAV24107.1 DNA polymerase III, subunit gamma and tau [Carboxydothermus islandicus]
MYLALYRKWRPKTFSEIVGQETIVKILKNAVATMQVAHAYLFSGPRGTGKTTTAKVLAKAVNCERPVDGEPCNQCPSCIGINNQSLLNVFEIDAASNRGIDEIRELRESIKLVPAQGKYKVYIIDEVHMLTNEAFNALLKTLEEPPEHVIFILATTEFNKVPVTIVSRCQRFDFKRISTKTIWEHLKNIAEKEKLQYEAEALHLIAEASEGGLRDALSLMDQVLVFNPKITVEDTLKVLGFVSWRKILELISAIRENNQVKIINEIAEVVDRGLDVKLFVQQILQYVRYLNLLKNGIEVEELMPEIQEKLKEEATFWEEDKLFHLWDDIARLEREIRYASFPRIWAEVGLLKVARNLELKPLKVANILKPVKENKEENKKESKKTSEEKTTVGAINLLKTPEWQEVLQKTREISPSLAIHLSKGIPFKTADSIKIVFTDEEPLNWIIHYKKGSQVKAIIKEVFTEALGEGLKITFNVKKHSVEEKTDEPKALTKAKELFGEDKVVIINKEEE